MANKEFEFRDRFGASQPRNIVDRYRMEEEAQWRPLADKMPYLRFPDDVEVRIIPPFGGAAARFTVRERGETNQNKSISVYFDSEDALGCMQQPYWEAYPIKEDTARFVLGEENELIETIARELRSQR